MVANPWPYTLVGQPLVMLMSLIIFCLGVSGFVSVWSQTVQRFPVGYNRGFVELGSLIFSLTDASDGQFRASEEKKLR